MQTMPLEVVEATESCHVVDVRGTLDHVAAHARRGKRVRGRLQDRAQRCRRHGARVGRPAGQAGPSVTGEQPPFGEQPPLEPGNGTEPVAEPVVPDPDALPIDEVALVERPGGAEGEPYWYWRVPGQPESLVGYRDPEVARKRGAVELRKRRQLQAMRRRP